MLSFRSVLFAAAAFATVVSAVPTPDVDSSLVQRTPLLEILDGLPIVGGLLGGPGLNVEGNTPAKRGRPSCGELINKCHGDIAVIAVKIYAACKVEGGAEKVDHGLVISLLWEVVALLKGLLDDLKLIVKADVVLGCSLEELAKIVGGLVILVIEVIWLVLSIVGFLDVALCDVIATIGGLLCEILGVVFFLVEGLLILVVEIIKPYGDHCKFVNYTKILILLGIKV